MKNKIFTSFLIAAVVIIAFALSAYCQTEDNKRVFENPNTVPDANGNYEVSGRVLTSPDGTGVATKVTLWDRSGHSVTTKSSEDGTFKFKSVKPNRSGYILHLEEKTPGIWSDSENVDVKSKDIRNKNLYLTLPQVISGVVLDDETSKPVDGAIIRVETEIVHNTHGMTTGTDGKFRIYVKPQRVTLTCDGTIDRYDANDNPMTFKVNPNQTIENVIFKVKSAHPITGLVRYPDGKAAANIPVYLVPGWRASRQSGSLESGSTTFKLLKLTDFKPQGVFPSGG